MPPYGIAKSVGGDTAATDKKMEDCVTKVMAEGNDKETAIKICKASIQRSIKIHAALGVKKNAD